MTFVFFLSGKWNEMKWNEIKCFVNLRFQDQKSLVGIQRYFIQLANETKQKNKTKQTKQNKTKQNKTKQNKTNKQTKQKNKNKTKQNKTKQKKKNNNNNKTKGLLGCRGAQKAQKSTIAGRYSAPNSAELDK